MDILLLTAGFFPFYRVVVQGLCGRGIPVRLHCALTGAHEKEQIADVPCILLPHVGGFRSEENIRLLINYLRREQIDLVLNPNIQIFDLEKLIRQTRKVLPGMRFIDLIHSCPDFIVRNKRTELREMTLRQVRTPKTAFQYLFPALYLALLKQSVKRRAMKAYALFDKTIVLTPRYAEEYRKFYGLPEEEKKVTAIPNPKIVRQPHVPVTEKEKTILFVGRLSREKALYRLFAVWKQLYRELPDWQLTIVGDGAERERYEQTVRTEQLERVSFLGEQPAIPYIDRAAILCLVSNFEGLPTVFTEAMTLGCVPVGFDSFSGIHEMIDHAENGIIVPAFDTAQYAAELKRLATDAPFRERLARGAMQKSGRFDNGLVVDLWEKLFNEISVLH